MDAADVARTQVEALRDDVRRILREERIRITGGIGGSGRTVQVRVPDAADRQKASVAISSAMPRMTKPPPIRLTDSLDARSSPIVTVAILSRTRSESVSPPTREPIIQWQ